MCLTDFCHPIELRAPALRVFLARSRHFRSGDAPRSLSLRAVDQGTGRFTMSETASAGRHFSAGPHASALRPVVMSVSVVFSRRWMRPNL